VGEAGLEPATKSALKTTLLEPGGAESGARPTDPEFVALAAAWPTLPDRIKAAIRALVGVGTAE
jgi:hypothetical protein